ncbi:MAG: hypothetical protein M0C28_02930 [Candidatus Moduliflexus flocculans]|nr:hypothetical protein [Candidatus Moduliflexus flocculans]
MSQPKIATLLEDRDLYRRLVNKITFEEVALLDFGGSYEVYRRNLNKLARKYGLDKPAAEKKG